MIVFAILCKNSLEMGLVKYNHVVQAFSTHASDDSFAVWILPRGARRGWNLLNAHAINSRREIATVDCIAVMNLKTGRFIIRKSVDDLLSRPFSIRIRGDLEMDDRSPIMTQHDEDVEYLKRNGWNGEEVAGCDIGNVVLQECSPCLRRGFSLSDHVFGHGTFRRFIAQQKQLG